MDFTHHILKTAETFGLWGYLLAFSLAFLESLAIVGGFIPGSTAIVLLGFMCARGYLNIYVLMFVTVLGAVLGDGVSYWLGTKGTGFFKNENRILKLRHLDMGQKFFEKHGDKSIFLGRFIGIIRPMIPFAAGLSRMNYRVFLFWNVVSGVVWGVSHIYLGYFFGHAFKKIETWSSRVSVLLLILAAVVVLLWLLAKAFTPVVTFIGRTVKAELDKLLDTPPMRKFKNRFPATTRFLSDRFEGKGFSGWPLTLTATTGLTFIVLLIILANGVLDADPVTDLDERIALFLVFFRDAHLLRVSLWFSLMGNFLIVLVSSLALVFSMLIWNRRYMIWPFVSILAVCETAILVMREFLSRPRPSGVIPAYLEKTYSFPGEHAALSVLLYGFIAYFVVHVLIKERPRLSIWTIFTALLLAGLVGLGRLYMGVNYLSDILGGYLVGGICLLAGIGVFEWVLQKNKGKNPYFLMEYGQKRILTYLLVSAPILFYIFYGTYVYKPEMLRGKEQQPTKVLTSGVSPAGIFYFNKWQKNTVGLSGRKREPISFLVWAKSDRQLTDAFLKCGWKIPDQPSARNFLKMALAVAGGKNYDSAPVTPVFWLNDSNDFAFEKITPDAHPRRHCVRFWNTNLVDAEKNSLYVGACGKTEAKGSLDVVDERNLLVDDFYSAGLLKRASLEKLRESPDTSHRSFHVHYFNDGMASVLILK